jgi:glutathione-regulated potassium-efflux system ancillary protein KefC
MSEPATDHNLLRDAMVYLGAAIVCVPLATRARLGSVLGYLAAGCAIGPFGLGFVKDVQSILHFAELGVVFMLFLIGLELDVRKLWAMRRPVFGGGAMQMGACGAVLALGLLVALGFRPAAAVIAGLAVALSSTAIAVQTMKERSLLTTPLGKSAFAILLFQDILAIPLIALVPLLAGKSSGSVLGVAQVFGAIAAVVVIGRYATAPLLRIVARTGLRELFTAFALLLVVGIGQLMTMAGVSMALGAFLAGVLLASSEYRHALETDVEPFKGLLMGLFFIAVGMSIDFALLRSHAFVVVLLVIALVGVKTVVLALLARRMDVSPKQRFLFGALLSQGGEFAFVVFGVASQQHLLPVPWDAILTLVVALSMAVTPVLLLVHDRWLTRDARADRDADKVEPEGDSVVIAGFGRFGQIVARLLLAAGHRPTLLDFDPDQVDFMRRLGFRVFFGDAARLDLLESAGAARAKLLVVAIDDVAASLRVVDIAREHFPKLEILARARNVGHHLELANRGVKFIERETFEASLRVARRALERLGDDPFEAREAADRFRAHNVASLEQLLPLLADEARRLSYAKAAREQFEAQFARDRALVDDSARTWTNDPATRQPAREDAEE